MDARISDPNTGPAARHRHRRPARRPARRMARALALTTLGALLAVVGLTSVGAVPNGSHWAGGRTKISVPVLGSPDNALRGSTWAGKSWASVVQGSSWA